MAIRCCSPLYQASGLGPFCFLRIYIFAPQYNTINITTQKIICTGTPTLGKSELIPAEIKHKTTLYPVELILFLCTINNHTNVKITIDIIVIIALITPSICPLLPAIQVLEKTLTSLYSILSSAHSISSGYR